jgi:hypothetical protein
MGIYVWFEKVNGDKFIKDFDFKYAYRLELFDAVDKKYERIYDDFDTKIKIPLEEIKRLIKIQAMGENNSKSVLKEMVLESAIKQDLKEVIIVRDI